MALTKSLFQLSLFYFIGVEPLKQQEHASGHLMSSQPPLKIVWL